MQPLHLVYLKDLPSLKPYAVNSSVSLSGSHLKVHFQVQSPDRVVNRDLPLDRSAYGLWETDVVEIFLSLDAKNRNHYYEFQLSPMKQFFELEIFEPRKKTNDKFHLKGFQKEVKIHSEEKWEAVLTLDLAELKWDGKPESICGNLFACLGDRPARAYFSLFLPEQKEPNFHLPEYFKSLL